MKSLIYFLVIVFVMYVLANLAACGNGALQSRGSTSREQAIVEWQIKTAQSVDSSTLDKAGQIA